MASIRHGAPTLLMASVLVLAACSADRPAPSAVGSADVDATAPATTAPDPCPNFVEHVDTGPQPTDFTETSKPALAQARLRNDIETSQAYAARHPAEFASIRIENAPRVRIVIGFTDHIAEHCAALRALLEHPDEFEIIKQAFPEARLDELMQEIGDKAGNHMLSLARMSGYLEMTLRPDGKAIADELVATYGDVLHIVQIGLLGYPDINAVTRPCQSLLATKIDSSPLRATLTIEAATVHSGQDFSGSVVIRNDGAIDVELNSGDPATAVLYRAGTNELVGGYDAGGEGVGFGGPIAPGASLTEHVISGTASCVPALGYALPAGIYDVRAVVEQYQPQPGGGIVVTDILSAPVPLEIVP